MAMGAEPSVYAAPMAIACTGVAILANSKENAPACLSENQGHDRLAVEKRSQIDDIDGFKGRPAIDQPHSTFCVVPPFVSDELAFKL